MRTWEAVARTAFDTHPEMVLRSDDIGCFVANWSDKATNLREIARRLNIGTDSLVFVDDNPAEREITRRELPEVAVPELPDDIARYPAVVAAAGYFEAVSLTGDDLARSRSYAANARRADALAATTDMPGYLRSLEMQLVARGRSAGPMGRATAFATLAAARDAQSRYGGTVADWHTVLSDSSAHATH